MKRRGWVLGGVAAAAAAAGVGWQLGRQRRGDGSAAAAGGAGAAAGLWQMSFPRPDGGTLSMARYAGAPLVLNFWATWCPPCVKEMPELDRWARQVRATGVQVIGLAIDSPTPVREFLARTPVSYAIALAGFEGTDLSRSLGNEQGALPFTAVFDRHGRLVHRKLGQTGFDELTRWLAGL
jgi:thiol-disulfide isomerase/thioredoxin